MTMHVPELTKQQLAYKAVRNRLFNTPVKRSVVPLVSTYKDEAAGIKPKTIEFELSFSISVGAKISAPPPVVSEDGAIRKPFQQICMEVLERHPGITLDDLKGRRVPRKIVNARHEAMWQIFQQRRDVSTPMIAKFFGGRDHTTVLHAVNKFRGGDASD